MDSGDEPKAGRDEIGTAGLSRLDRITMASLLEQVADEQNLRKAFLKSRRSIWSPRGYMGRQFLQVWNNWETECHLLQTELLSDSFTTAGNQAVIIRRSLGGKPRGIYRACVRDKWVQQAIFQVIQPPLGAVIATPASYGRKEASGEGSRSIRILAQNIQSIQATKSFWAYETDIKGFFPSVGKERLLSMLSKALPDTSLDYLLKLMVDTTVEDYFGEAADPQYRHFWDADTGIPQGNVLSPLFANLYLHEFDQWIMEQGWLMFRYVDDLIIFCKDEREANRAAVEVSSQLSNLDLQIHEIGDDSKKAAIRRPGSSVTFVGISFSGSRMRPTDAAVDRLMKRVQEHCFDDVTGAPTLYELLTRVNNLLRGWHAAYGFCQVSLAFRRTIDRKVAYLVGLYAQNRKFISRASALQKVEDARWFGLVQLADLTNNVEYPDERPEDSANGLNHFGIMDGQDTISVKPR